jgi:hypothetical protein
MAVADLLLTSCVPIKEAFISPDIRKLVGQQHPVTHVHIYIVTCYATVLMTPVVIGTWFYLQT